MNEGIGGIMMLIRYLIVPITQRTLHGVNLTSVVVALVLGRGEVD